MRKTNKKFKAFVKKGTVVVCASSMLLSNTAFAYAADDQESQYSVEAVKSGSGITLEDGTILAEGKYNVPVSLNKDSSETEQSMAHDAMGETALLEVSGNTATITLNFKTLALGFGANTLYGNVDGIRYLDNKDQTKVSEPWDVGHDTEILSYRNDAMTSDAMSGASQSGITKPKEVKFTLPYTNSTYVYIVMHVDVMQALGMSSTTAAVMIDYANAEKIVEKESLTEKIDSAKAILPDQYTAESFAALTSAINAAELVKDNNAATQDQVDEQISKLEKAIQGLVYKAADYTKVDSMLKKVPNDLSQYTEESANNVRAAVKAVDRNKNVTEQSQVDAMADRIAKAVQSLVVKTPAKENQSEKEKLDKDHLADGTYQVSVYLWNATADKPSMAATSMQKNAKIVVKDGVYRMYINTTSMTFGSITARLQDMYTYNQAGEKVAAQVETRNETGDPTSFSFVMPTKDEYIKVAVNPHVALMGNMDIDARIKVDYSTLSVADSNNVNKNDNTTNNQNKTTPNKEAEVNQGNKEAEKEAAQGQQESTQQTAIVSDSTVKTGDNRPIDGLLAAVVAAFGVAGAALFTSEKNKKRKIEK